MTTSYRGYVACWPEQMLRFCSPRGTSPQNRHVGQTSRQQDARTAKTTESNTKQGNERWEGRTEWRTGGTERSDTQIPAFL